MINFIEFNNVGAINSEVAISVLNAAAVAYTIPAGKKGVSFQNVGTTRPWYGGSDVNPAAKKGNKIFQNQSLVFKNVKNSFTIYFKCAAGETGTIAVVNYD